MPKFCRMQNYISIKIQRNFNTPLNVVVVQVLGLGVVVVLGPFLDRMTASQFCAGSTWSPYCARGGFAIAAAAAIRSSREIAMFPIRGWG